MTSRRTNIRPSNTRNKILASLQMMFKVLSGGEDHATEKTLQATAAALHPISGASGAGAAGAELESVLAELEGLSKEERKKVAGRLKELPRK